MCSNTHFIDCIAENHPLVCLKKLLQHISELTICNTSIKLNNTDYINYILDNYNIPIKYLINTACETGNLVLLKHFVAINNEHPHTITMYKAPENYYEVFQYVNSKNYIFDTKNIKLLLAIDDVKNFKLLVENNIIDIDDALIDDLFAYSSLKCIKYVKTVSDIKFGIESIETFNVNCIKFIFDEFGVWANRAAYFIAASNDLHMLKHAKENNCPNIDEFLYFYIISDNWECFTYLLNHENVKHSSVKTSLIHAKLKYFISLCEHGLPLDPEILNNIIANNDSRLLEYYLKKNGIIQSSILNLAAANDNIDHLKILKKYNISIPESAISYAAKYSEKCLKYLYNEGYKLNYHTMVCATQYDNINCLKFIYECGFYWFDYFDTVVAKNNFRYLSLLYETGFQWSEHLPNFCYKTGISFDEFKSFHMMGIPWNSISELDNDLKFLQYKMLHQNNIDNCGGCFLALDREKRMELIKYIFYDNTKLPLDLCNIISTYCH